MPHTRTFQVSACWNASLQHDWTIHLLDNFPVNSSAYTKAKTGNCVRNSENSVHFLFKYCVYVWLCMWCVCVSHSVSKSIPPSRENAQPRAVRRCCVRKGCSPHEPARWQPPVTSCQPPGSSCFEWSGRSQRSQKQYCRLTNHLANPCCSAPWLRHVALHSSVLSIKCMVRWSISKTVWTPGVGAMAHQMHSSFVFFLLCFGTCGRAFPLCFYWHMTSMRGKEVLSLSCFSCVRVSPWNGPSVSCQHLKTAYLSLISTCVDCIETFETLRTHLPLSCVVASLAFALSSPCN